MRLHTTVAAGLGALALIVALPTSANAATGEFTYKYTDRDGTKRIGRLLDPDSRECITLPEVVDLSALGAAHTPRNDTSSSATVFADVDCEGTSYYSLWPGDHAGKKVKLRSVVFS